VNVALKEVDGVDEVAIDEAPEKKEMR